MIHGHLKGVEAKAVVILYCIHAIQTYTAFAVNWMKKLLYSIYLWVVTFLNLNYDSLP